jgi:hypothetical protein
MAWQGPEYVERLVRRPTLTASCARRLCNTAGSGRRNGISRSNKETDEESKKKRSCSETRLTEAHTRHKRRNREAENTDAPERGGLLRSSDEAG